MAWITAKYDGKCAECEEDITAGDRIVITNEATLKNQGGARDTATKVFCHDCGEEVEGPDPQAVMKNDHKKGRWAYE